MHFRQQKNLDRTLDFVLDLDYPDNIVLNINFPDIVEGNLNHRFTRQGKEIYQLIQWKKGSILEGRNTIG